MSEANNQPIEKTRITSLYIERVYNLGNYENIKYGVRVDITEGDDAGRVLKTLERIFGDLRVQSGVSDHEFKAAKRALDLPEEQLDEYQKEKLPKYREYVERRERAALRRRNAREALATLNYTIEYKDHKQDWDDDCGDDEHY